MSRNQRRIMNYVRAAGLSKGYYLHVFGGGLAFLGIMAAYATRLLTEVSEVAATIPDPNLAASLQDRLYMVTLVFFVGFLAFMASTVFYMLIIGQRVGGPIVAICAYISELKKGNYDAQRNLRQNDELVPILLELKDLARILKSKAK